MSNLMRHIKLVVQDDIRLFFAPFKGAYDAIKRELKRPARRYVDASVSEEVQTPSRRQ
jgi:hypothetical protein